MKGMDLVFNIRELDNDGVCASSKLETKDINEAINTCQNLMTNPHKKWIIVATSMKECKE